MPDLTDSYCERCGARYSFSPPTPKNVSLKGARVLAKGLKNFVLNDGQSMADSLTIARHEDEHEDSSRVTEAFHRTFNFCMTCRQYACDACWNHMVGACLSCAPESGFAPTAPEDHLIVRTPVARWNTDWSLFPDGPVVEPVSRPDPPAPFNAPIRLPESRATLPSKTPAPAVWPAADLPEGLGAAASGASGKSGHRPSHKPADPAAVSLWPIADEIAPDMTLTPEELDVVESSLGQGETAQDSAQSGLAAPESPLVGTPLQSPAPERVAAKDTALPPEWTSLGATRRSPSAPMWEPAASGGFAASPHPMAQQSVDRESDPLAPGPEPELPPQRILRITEAAPHLPPPTPHTPEPPAHERAGLVAKLLGRQGSPTEASKPDQPRRAPARNGQPSGDPWPLATRWTERPIEAGRDEPAASAEAVAPLAAPSLPPGPVAAQPTVNEQDDFDARSAAAERLSAVQDNAVVPGEPIEEPPIPAFLPVWADSPTLPEAPIQQPSTPIELTPGLTLQGSPFGPPPAVPAPRQPAVAEPTAWPEADREVVEAQRPRTTGTPPSRPVPPTPWPPLGASYPAQADPGAPWPGPEGAPAPAVVAAQSASAPPMADMWAQSSQEVLNRGTVRVCHRCALPVSTQARFCRRCGTRQG
jgi:hypothetical protein